MSTTSPTYQQVLNAIQKSEYTQEQLWNLQVEAAAQQLEEGIGTRWRIDLPFMGVSFSEDEISAGVMREVSERTRVPMFQMGFDGLMADGRLIFEFVRAYMVVQLGREEADVEAILNRVPMKDLVEATTQEVVAPDPFEPSGTLHEPAPWVRPSSDEEATPSDA